MNSTDGRENLVKYPFSTFFEILSMYSGRKVPPKCYCGRTIGMFFVKDLAVGVFFFMIELQPSRRQRYSPL